MGLFDGPSGGAVTAPAVIILILFLAFLAFTLFLLLHGDHRRQLPVQLAASIMFGHVPIALFLHPGSIQMYLSRKPITHAYCCFYLHNETFAYLIIPYSLWMFTIERLIYIKDPTGYAQKIKRAGAIALVIFPWVFSILYSILDINIYTYGVVTKVITNHTTNNSAPICLAMPFEGSFPGQAIARGILGFMIPVLTSLVVTITVLVMWCCYKCRASRGTDYSMMGLEVTAIVRNSVIALAIMNGIYLPIFIAEMVTRYHLRMQFSIINLYGVIQGTVLISTIDNVRNKFVGLFQCCSIGKQKEAPIVGYSVNEPNVTDA